MPHPPEHGTLPRLTVDDSSSLRSSPPDLLSSTKAATPVASGDTAEKFVAGQATALPFRFGGYLVLREIARGGMGVVYQACDTVLGREIALKMVRSGPQSNSVLIDRFYHEAQAVAALKHPHVIQVFDFGVIDGQHYFTMTLAEGGNLREHIGRFQADVRAAVALVEKVARTVDHVHCHGLLHRDLKPGNILLDAAGEPLVSDFGLVKSIEVDLELTRTGGAVGTPSYMAPEQAAGRGDLVCPATDIWGLGILLYELLCRRRPFEGDSREEVVRAIQEDMPAPPESLRPQVDRDLAAIVLKCLEKEPAYRYATAAGLADDLSAWLKGEPVQARPIGKVQRAGRWLRRHPLRVAALLTIFVAAAATVLAMQRLDPERELRRVHDDLAAGKSVTLIGETGPPRWHRWQVEGTLFSSRPGETFSLNSGSLSLLELVKAPLPERFEFRAEVNQEPTADGRAGIYIGHAADQVGADKYHSFIVYRFADWGRYSGEDDAGNGSAEMRAVHYFHPRVGTIDSRTGGLLAPRKFVPRRLDAKEVWRALTLRVSPEGITACWDDQPFGQVTPDRKAIIAQSLVLGAPDRIDRMPDFPPSGGIGLFLDSCVASFRNVVLTPK